MKSTQQLIQPAVQLMANSVSEKPLHQVQPAHEKLVDSAFEKLSILFPIGAPTPDKEAAVKAEWLKTMAVQGVLETALVQQGLMRARKDVSTRQYWPSPLQFCQWCKMEWDGEHQLPDVRTAYREAVSHYRSGRYHAWSHPVVYVCIMAIGTKAFKTCSDADLFKQFSYQYELQCRRVRAGEDLSTEVPKALPAKGESCRVATPECQGYQKVMQLRAKLPGYGSNKGIV